MPGWPPDEVFANLIYHLRLLPNLDMLVGEGPGNTKKRYF